MEILRYSFVTSLIMFAVFAILGAIFLWFEHKLTSIIMFVISGLCCLCFFITGGIFGSNNEWIEVKKYTEKAVITDMYSKEYRKVRCYGKFSSHYTVHEYYIVTETAEGEEDTWNVSERSYDNVEEGQQVYVVTHYYETEYTHDTMTEKTWWYE